MKGRGEKQKKSEPGELHSATVLRLSLVVHVVLTSSTLRLKTLWKQKHKGVSP